MMQRRRLGLGRPVLAALILTACSLDDRASPRDAETMAVRLAFEDVASPEVFARDGLARRDRPDGAAGLWAAVSGLARPERALVENRATGAEVSVALFTGGRDARMVLLSNEAADALGITDEPVPVRVTALRREPRLLGPEDRF